MEDADHNQVKTKTKNKVHVTDTQSRKGDLALLPRHSPNPESQDLTENSELSVRGQIELRSLKVNKSFTGNLNEAPS